MTESKQEALRLTIAAEVVDEHKSTICYDYGGAIIKAIIDNAPLVMDALMEAKAISQVEKMWNADGTETFIYYELKNPKSHVHEPYVKDIALSGHVLLACNGHGCFATRYASPSLPIKWPDDE
jgi:hypothetical protein